MRIRTLISMLGLLLIPAAALADPIDVIGTTGSWQSMVTPNADGTPFWDQTSSDGTNLNVGFFLTKTGGFSSHANSPAFSIGDLEYFGNGSAFDSNVHFVTNPANASVQTTLYLEVAGLSGSNVLGYYDSTGDHVLFVGSDSPVKVAASFTAVGAFGLYITANGITFRSDPGLHGTVSGDSFQHFAVFKEKANGKLWIGVEDLPNGGDKDYNDMVISLQALPVPEPASVLVLGIGGLALGAGRLLRRRKPLHVG